MYTHYYTMGENLDDLKVKEIGRDIATVISRCEIPIGNGDGELESVPQISSRIIQFNGIDEDSGDGFLYPPPFEENRRLGLDERFSYCKTSRRRYDAVVCIALLILKYHLGDGVRIGSDGSLKEIEWRRAIALHDHIFRDRDGENLAAEIRKG